MRLGITLLVAGLGIAALYVASVYFLQRKILFPGPLYGIAVPEVEGIERWRVGPHDVEAWFLPPLGPGEEPAGEPFPTLVFAHGNGELIDFWPEVFEEPRRWGVGVLLVEYPGYGRSGGSPSERSVTESMVAAYDRLLERPGVDPDAVVGYGRSLGGGAVCALAARRPVAALVLESTFRSVRSLAGSMLVPGFLIRDPFDNLAVISAFEGPVLLIHGKEDTIIPAAESKALHEAAPDSTLHLIACGHNDCPRPWGMMRSFLDQRGIVSSELAPGRSNRQAEEG